MLSSKAKYAVRAMAFLAEHYVADGWTQTADVAAHERIPRKFLEAIFVQLRGHGVIESRRGAHGGHRLRGDAAAVSVADVIRIIDGPLALTPCASRTRFGACPDCVDPAICRLQPLMSEARDAVASVLENCSLAQLAKRRDPAPDTEKPLSVKAAKSKQNGRKSPRPKVSQQAPRAPVEV
jgi:Rrf2 family protein